MWERFLVGKCVLNVRSLDDFVDIVKRVKSLGIEINFLNNSEAYDVFCEKTCLIIGDGVLDYADIDYFKNVNIEVVTYENNTQKEQCDCDSRIIDIKEILHDYINGNASLDDFDYITAVNLNTYFIDNVLDLELGILLEMLYDDDVVFIK